MKEAHNPHMAWRLAFAREVAAKITKYEGLRAIVVGGSVARGYADRYSDLEMPLFWDELPSDERRLAIIADLEATFLYGYDGPAQEDQLLINGFQVDFWHNTVAYEEATIDAVLKAYDTDLGSSNFMDTVRACISLYGDEIVRRWKQRARDYPDGLAVRSIAENVAHLEIGHLEVHAARENPTMVYSTIGELQKRVFMILLALNKEYYPTPKWMYQAMRKMGVKPRDVVRRFREAFHRPQDEAIADTVAVVQETLSLVDERYPQVDTASMHKKLSLPRRAYDVPVRLGEGSWESGSGDRGLGSR
jgi:hypothetical protein